MVAVPLELELGDLGLELGAPPSGLVPDLLLLLTGGVEVALMLHPVLLGPVGGRALLLIELEPKLLRVPLQGPELLLVLCRDARALGPHLRELPPEPLLLLV